MPPVSSASASDTAFWRLLNSVPVGLVAPRLEVSVLTTTDHRSVAPLVHSSLPASVRASRMRGGGRRCWVPLAVLTAIVLSHSIAAEPTKQVRRILILNEAGPSYPAINIINQGIQTALQNSPYKLEFYSEYLDTLLFPDPATQQEFRDFYLRKYQNRRPDVIITVGPSPLKFMVEVHGRAFPGVPIIFCLPNGTVPGGPALDPDFTGVENDIAPAETLEVALRLQPGTEHVFVIGGASDYDKQGLAAVKQQLRPFTDRVNITYITDLAMPDLLERLRHLPNHTVVLFVSVGQDAAGIHFKSSETGPMVAAAANAPVFSLFDLYLNHGEVGGDLSSVSDQGRVAGDMALRILNGAKPQDIPRVKPTFAYMFDWRALERWELRETALPPGSIVLNRQVTLWESYKGYIIGGISLILVETLLIFGLLRQRAKRRRAEAELAVTYERLRLAVQAGKAVGWDWDIESGRNRWFGDLQTMFGIPSDSYSGNVEDFRRRIHPKDRELVSKAVADAKQSQKPFTAEFRVVRLDETIRWITANGKFYYAANGVAERMIGMAADITERKASEEALASLSGRLIDAQEEERKRIAREIHDDYNQRLAILAMDLEQLADKIGDPSVETGQQFHEIWNRICELGADLHSLSHRLHSSTLDSLGLVAGAKAFCKEFAQQQEIQVDFVHENIPHGVPGEVALCLFRILQEGLRNIKRHSGADRADVRLERSGERLHLSVADRGRGFDVNMRSPRDGIGIRSMEERLRSLGGQLEINSRPMDGTRIDAWLSLKVASERVA